MFFLGIGKMGLPMADHLARHAQANGHGLTVGDPSAPRRALALAQGLKVATEVPAAIGRSQLIFSSLPDDTTLRAVAGVVAQAAQPGTIYVDTSTVSPQASAQAAQLLVQAGVVYLRCTLSGNNKMAEAAQLTVLASGPRATYDQVLPCLRCFGPNQFYLGEAEQARLMKLVINLMIAQTSAMLAESLTLGRKGGLDWQAMWQVLGASAVASPILKAKAAQLSQRDFAPTFTVTQMIKDLDLILGAGDTAGLGLPQTAMTRSWMREAADRGLADEDYAAIIKVLEQDAGLGASA